MPQTPSWNNRLHILVVDNHRVVNNFDTHQNPPNPLMTVRHYTLLESFYDIFEFTSKIKQQEKQEKLKNLKKKKKGIVSRLLKNVSRFRALKKHAFDIGENVSQWQKRDTIIETLIWVVCYASRNVSRFT